MVKTEKYQFNLVEKEDTFSPGPLNENTQKVEAALETKADAAAHAALDQRVQVLELRHFATGSYTGTNGSNTVQLGFTPRVVQVMLNEAVTSFNPYIVINDSKVFNANTEFLKIVEGGFWAGGTLASSGKTYYYAAQA